MVAAIAIGAGVVAAGASMYSSGKQADAAESAANTQAQSNQAAAAQQQAQYAQTVANLAPYNAAGQDSLSQVNGANGDYNALSDFYNTSSANFLAGEASQMPTMTSAAYVPTQTTAAALPGTMSQAQLEQTPGYQFNLAQGLKATQNSAAARGLGVSGAALKGAATYATGLADSTYQNQFNNAQTNYLDQYNNNSQTFGQQQSIFGDQATLYGQGQQNFADANTIFGNQQTIAQMQQSYANNKYNRLMGVSQLGENAAAMTGSIGQQSANAVGNNLTAAGTRRHRALSGWRTRQPNGVNGVTNALTSGANQYLYANPNQTGTAAASNATSAYGTQNALAYGAGGLY
jgi:hypothetical protein